MLERCRRGLGGCGRLLGGCRQLMMSRKRWLTRGDQHLKVRVVFWDSKTCWSVTPSVPVIVRRNRSSTLRLFRKQRDTVYSYTIEKRLRCLMIREEDERKEILRLKYPALPSIPNTYDADTFNNRNNRHSVAPTPLPLFCSHHCLHSARPTFIMPISRFFFFFLKSIRRWSLRLCNDSVPFT